MIWLLAKSYARIGFRSSTAAKGLEEFTHRNGRVCHTVGETPLVVIPRKDATHVAIHDFGLIRCKD